MSGLKVGRNLILCNRRGLHARASAKLARLAGEMEAAVTVEKDGQKVTATSIMGLMMLGAAFGDQIRVEASGAGAEEALQAVTELVEGRFSEAE